MFVVQSFICFYFKEKDWCTPIIWKREKKLIDILKKIFITLFLSDFVYF